MELTKEQMSELSDEVLCVNACAGDRASEEALVMRYQQLTRACARPYFLAGGDSEDPVSYTHLRSHETCSDRVCRLLL